MYSYTQVNKQDMAEKIAVLRIQSITCNGCASNVRKALRSFEGVKDAKVELENKTATVVFDAEQTNEDMLKKTAMIKRYGVD